MTTLMRYDPFREALSLRNAVSQLFEDSFVHPGWFRDGTSTSIAPMDVYETEQGYQIHILLPGVKGEDIDLSMQQNSLSIKGQYKPLLEEGEKVNWLVQEIGSGSFERTITFPKPINVDQVETSYENGILTITAPFSEESRPKRISITGGQQKQLVEAGTR